MYSKCCAQRANRQIVLAIAPRRKLATAAPFSGRSPHTAPFYGLESCRAEVRSLKVLWFACQWLVVRVSLCCGSRANRANPEGGNITHLQVPQMGNLLDRFSNTLYLWTTATC